MCIQFSGDLNAITSCATTNANKPDMHYRVLHLNNHRKQRAAVFPHAVWAAVTRYKLCKFIVSDVRRVHVHRICNYWIPYAFVHPPCPFYDYSVRPQNVNRFLCFWCMLGKFTCKMLNANSTRQSRKFKCHSFGRCETINKSWDDSTERVATKGVNNTSLPHWFDEAHEAFLLARMSVIK